MPRATTPTLLSLDQYARIVGLHRPHFAGVVTPRSDYNDASASLWYQEPWMNAGAMSREELATAIAAAERLIAERLGYWPAPAWTAGEEVVLPRPVRGPGGTWLAVGADSYAGRVDHAPRLRCAWGRVLRGGRRATERLLAGAALTYSDPDGDGYPERAALTLVGAAADGLDPAEVALFAPDEPPEEQGRIRELTVRAVGDDLEVVGEAELFVRPALWAREARIDGDDPTNFLEAVDVYRVWTRDDTPAYSAAELRWERPAGPLAHEAADGVLLVHHGPQGIVAVRPARWDEATGAWETGQLLRPPDQVRLHYLSGAPRDAAGRVAQPYARLIAALATALVAKPVHAFGPDDNLMSYWQSVPVEVPYKQQICPWGPRMGAWETYATLQGMLGIDSASL